MIDTTERYHADARAALAGLIQGMLTVTTIRGIAAEAAHIAETAYDLASAMQKEREARKLD